MISSLDFKSTGCSGYVAAGFEEVAEQFERNFTERGEVGAAFAATHDGEVVVDLWGGLANRETSRPWTADSLQLIFSGTKGLVTVCVLMLVERGLLDIDAPVARYWPAFAAAGKRDVLVRHVLCHQAGLPGVRERIETTTLATGGAEIVRLLERQAPLWSAGTQVCYHPLTFGWLCGELIRRVDGRSVGRFLAEEVAGPLGGELWLGLPPEHEPRVTRLEAGGSWGSSPQLDEERLRAEPTLASVWANPPVFTSEWQAWNSPPLHQAEIPGANAIATARAVARVYGCMAQGGCFQGTRLLSAKTIDAARTPLAVGVDPLADVPIAYGLGFQLQTDKRPFGAPRDAFGHGGAGGSIHGAWPAARVGFSYAMNELREDEPDLRAVALLAALARAVRAAPVGGAPPSVSSQ